MKKSPYARFAVILLFIFSLFAVSGCEKDPTVTPEAVFEEVKATPQVWDGTKRADISYQLLVYSFADQDGDGWGDFKGLTAKLDYIDGMGASAIWLSPIHPSGSYHGYDVEDYAAVNPTFGTMADFRQFVEEAHKRDIKVYLDYVINHSGKGHKWFKEATSSMDNAYRNYYIFSSNPSADIAAGKIPMIATEGASGYDSGQWFSISSNTEGVFKFTLDWSNASRPLITITKAETPDSDNPDNSTANAKYLYFGDGVCKKFYPQGNNVYTLTVDFSSNWGFLIRTSNSESWPVGTKYGAQSSSNSTVTFGVPFALYTSTSNNSNVYDIKFAGGSQYWYHSHFWTSYFADLNYGSAATAETSPAFKAVVEDAKVWIDAGIDGFRLDAVKHIYHNENSDENPTFLKKFYDAVNTYYRTKHSGDIYMVGEVFSEYNKVAPYYRGLPAYFEFSFWWRLLNAINDGKGANFADNLISYRKEYIKYRTDCIEATKLSNHDEVRACSELGGSLAKTKIAAAILMTAEGSPYIYYGEELGYTGKKDNGDEYVRTPMYWGDNYVTSYTDKIDPAVQSAVGSVSRQESDTTSMLNFYRKLTRIRNTYPALAQGTMSAHPIVNSANAALYPSMMAWYMTSGTQKLLVLHNVGGSDATISIDDALQNAVFVNGKVMAKKDGNAYKVMLSGYSSAVFLL